MADASQTSGGSLPPSQPEVQSTSIFGKMNAWGTSSLAPALLATLTTALHARPLQIVPLAVFTPTLLFSSYLNLSGYPTASAGITAAWSGLYFLLALKRKQGLRGRFSPRGMVRGAALGLAASNAVAGGWVYMRGDFERDEKARKARNRWVDKE